MLQKLGSSILKRISFIKYSVGYLGKVLLGVPSFIVRGQASWKILIMQILFTFVEALGVTLFLSIGLGALLCLVGFPLLSGISQTQLMYPVLVMAVIRELGPLLTAFIIIARSATAIATELAGMVVSHEIEAYISVGVDPIQHLVIPRFLGLICSLLLLNIYFILGSFLGSFFAVEFLNIVPAEEFLSNFFKTLTIGDILVTITKSIVFGVIISVVATSRGFAVQRASTEVPMAGLKAVSSSFVWCIFVDICITGAFYAIG